MNVETVPIDSVTLDPTNVRVHPSANLEAIKGSLARFGQQKPLVVDASGVIRAGNGTLLAAKALGWTEIKIVRSALAGPDATAYSIADNRTGDLSTFDDLGLCKLLDSIKRTDEQLFAATGHDDGQFDKLVESIGNEEMAQKAIGNVASQEDGRADMYTGLTVRIVVKVANLAFIERVLASTGKDMKGEALQVVCEAYAKLHGG